MDDLTLEEVEAAAAELQEVQAKISAKGDRLRQIAKQTDPAEKERLRPEMYAILADMKALKAEYDQVCEKHRKIFDAIGEMNL